MGLDMYLERMPRYKEATASQVSLIKNYFDWNRRKQQGSTNYTFKEWSGFGGNEIAPVDVIEFYKPFYKVNDYGLGRIADEVGYWRKTNHIHQWFVDHVQDGIDDCCYHHEVTKEILEELLDICETVIENPIVAEELIPTSSGFFFGSTDYDEYYLDGVKHTIDVITRVLETTDFDKEMIYYVSSW